MKKFVFYFTLFINISAICLAQNEKPKLGLVLSGGGAKGLAHIGVIRVLESQGIYPDYVTGTSMGALIGGLYSIGYTPDEMEEVVRNIEWDHLLTNSTPLSEITIEEKPFYGRYLLELGLEKGKIVLPRGLIEGQKLNELFSRLTRSVHHIHDFSEFPIPFACVASDISTGEKVILDHGFLPEAMRASMAIPSIFTTVEIDGKLLVDGGLVRNFPVQEARDMGADIVIGVFVSSDLNPKEELTNMIEVLSQSAFIFSAFDTREQSKLVDFLITPDLEGYYTQSFEEGLDIVKAGEVSALDLLDSIKTFKEKYLIGKEMKPARKLRESEGYFISEIIVNGNEHIDSEFILGKLNISPDTEISIDDIEKRIDLLYGTRYFTKINYIIDENANGNLLVLDVKEALQSKLSVALHYDSENRMGANFNLTFRNVLLKNSRILTEVDIAESPRAYASYFKYLGIKQRTALNLGVNYENLPLPVYEDDGSQRGVFGTDYFTYFLQWQMTNHQNYTFGLRYASEFSKLKPEIADPELAAIEKVKLRNHSVSVFYNRNTLNRPFYPTKGTLLTSNAKYEFGINNSLTYDLADSLDAIELDVDVDGFFQFMINYIQYFKLSPKSTFMLQAKAVISDIDTLSLNLTDYQYVGGFNPRYIHANRFWGVNDKEFTVTSYSYFQLMYQYEPFKDIYLQGLVNYIDGEFPMEFLLKDYESNTFGDLTRRFGFGFSAGYNSKLGPIMVALAKDIDRKNWKTYLNIGFWF